jgi:hypothetical protein
MRSVKTMFFGILLALLGIGMIQPANDLYLSKTFSFLSGNVMSTIFPIISIILIVLGIIFGITGLFVRN